MVKGLATEVRSLKQAKGQESGGIQIAEKVHEVTQEAKAAGMNKKEIAAVVAKSFAVDGSPYLEVPKDIIALAKTQK